MTKSVKTLLKELNGEREKPSRLFSEVVLEIHTQLAKTLFLGQRKAFVGVPQFSQRMHHIWQATAQGDPYADYFLIKVYDALTRTKRELLEVSENVKKMLSSQQHVIFTEFASNKPFYCPLRFATPYGYQAAFLLADFDVLLQNILTAKYTAVDLAESWDKLIKRYVDKLRRTLITPLNWKPTGVTRDDLNNMTDTAKQAIAAMGQVPEPILNRSLTAPFAPRTTAQP